MRASLIACGATARRPRHKRAFPNPNGVAPRLPKRLGLAYVDPSEQVMNENNAIEFVLHGKVEGQEITPRTIGLSQFNEFNQQVEQFISG